MLVGGGLGLVVGKQCFSVAHREPKDEVQYSAFAGNHRAIYDMITRQELSTIKTAASAACCKCTIEPKVQCDLARPTTTKVAFIPPE